MEIMTAVSPFVNDDLGEVSGVWREGEGRTG